MSADDYDSLIESVDILSSPSEVEALRVAIGEFDAGDVSTPDEVRAGMIASGRLSK